MILRCIYQLLESNYWNKTHSATRRRVASDAARQALIANYFERLVNEINNNNNCKMDIKIQVKEEDPLSDDIACQNEGEFFTKNVTMEANSDAVLLEKDSDMAIKAEMKSETPFPNFCSQKDRESNMKHTIKQMRCETVTCRTNNCEIDMKTEIEEQTLLSDFGSQNESKFLPEGPAMKLNKYNMDHEIDIKEEPWWLEGKTSSFCDDIQVQDFPPVKHSRLFTEAISSDSSGKSPIPTPEVLGRDKSFYNEKECETQGSDITEIPTVEEHVHIEQSDKCSNWGEICNRASYFKQKNLIHKVKRTHKCNTCEKSFTHVSHLKSHEFVHGAERLHRYTICDKSFTQFSDLKMHSFINEDKTTHQCKTCDKSFTQLSRLKIHNLIHEGKKPHQCKICGKSFTQLSHLKMHNLIHEGKKPHQCKTCDKSFTLLSNLKRHNLIHEGKKSHQCKTCDKSFTRLSGLKMHNLVHEGMKPHQCKTCDKSFTRLSDLKNHNLIHEGKKPHQCKTCSKSFTQLSSLKTHNLIHEGKKPHRCKTCDKSFTQLSHLKMHNLIHEGKKPHQCKTCSKSFTHLSNLKRHNLVHKGKKP